jgi:hypothetical protein
MPLEITMKQESEADLAQTTLDMLRYADTDENMGVEVLVTYSKSLLSGTHPEWTLAEHMNYALLEWGI